ncbi:hypothetical protein FIBSPDRAFT_944926 [Athelia psychrophila]|uniref:Uncharacterized protein n=1 Tax=Athelia psychrophila TaxID=1759441 RepID=A0A166UNA3_9AGAM|nr:hypothetical protein FIBSPDRAFT_944926 [Fibularhizoctonia sp. CBS 109695]
MFDFGGTNQSAVGMLAPNNHAIASGSETILPPIIFRIKWDGVRISRGNMTCAEIAKRVAQSFQDFINHAYDFPIDPSRAQFRGGRGSLPLYKLV